MSRLVSVSDVRGGVRLATDTALGVTDVVEAMHATIASPLGRPKRARGLTGWIYRIVRGTMRRVGRMLDVGLAAADRGRVSTESPARDAVVAALDGAFGDRMEAERNPLATSLHIRHAGQPLEVAALATPRSTLLLQIHGICMHDGQWGTLDHDPGALWAEALDATRLTLRYNSGRHISENGRELARRINFGLTGLPLLPREVADFEAAFQKDPKQAVADFTKKKMMSKHYGENFGRQWLDVARYADSAGFANDYASPKA